MPTKVLLAEPRGFCAGVEMAINALTWMVKVFEPPVYCYHEIVHNAAVAYRADTPKLCTARCSVQLPCRFSVIIDRHIA